MNNKGIHIYESPLLLLCFYCKDRYRLIWTESSLTLIKLDYYMKFYYPKDGWVTYTCLSLTFLPYKKSLTLKNLSLMELYLVTHHVYKQFEEYPLLISFLSL